MTRAVNKGIFIDDLLREQRLFSSLMPVRDIITQKKTVDGQLIHHLDVPGRPAEPDFIQG
jgi:hypothetical protein